MLDFACHLRLAALPLIKLWALALLLAVAANCPPCRLSTYCITAQRLALADCSLATYRTTACCFAGKYRMMPGGRRSLPSRLPSCRSSSVDFLLVLARLAT